MEELLLERVMGRIVLGEDQQACGIAIEAVDDSWPGFGVMIGKVIADDADGGRPPLAGDGAGKQAGRFVDDEDVGVLVNQF
jgi:hypothetical protein